MQDICHVTSKWVKTHRLRSTAHDKYWEPKNQKTVGLICLTVFLFPRGSCLYSKTLDFSLEPPGMLKSSSLQRHEGVTLHKDPLRTWKRSITIRAGSLKVPCQLLWSEGCGRTMAWVSRGRILVIVLQLLFPAVIESACGFNDSTLSLSQNCT